MWKSIFPPLQWIKGYSPKHLQSDALPASHLQHMPFLFQWLTLRLQDLPVQYGIYGYLIGGIFYAIFGTGKQLAIGPTSAISLLIGTTIATMANGDAQRWAEIASLTALVMGH